ncbi:MAG: type II secretion system F family protein, partial [bacterium]|nr:type II secretion system F family protein [bacterium]
LPLMTRIVSSAATFLTSFGPLLILLFVGLVVGFFFLLKNKKTKEKLDPFLLRLPLVGKIIKKYILARFLRVVGSCLKYGVPLGASFATVGAIVGNVYYQQACRRIEVKITKGKSLSEALGEEEASLFPRLLVRSIRGAEKTGSVDEAMIRLSQFYEDDIDRGLKRMTDLIEPALVIVLGIIVAAIAISVIAPIYQMTSKIK